MRNVQLDYYLYFCDTFLFVVCTRDHRLSREMSVRLGTRRAISGREREQNRLSPQSSFFKYHSFFPSPMNPIYVFYNRNEIQLVICNLKLNYRGLLSVILIPVILIPG